MEDILKEFNDHGWGLKNVEEMYSVQYDDMVYWTLKKPNSELGVTIMFYVVDGLGNSTSELDLDNVLYCVDAKSGMKLYFEKRNSAIWCESVKKFTDSLCEMTE
ncbi:MAG TPA: hypothetical protein VNQ76_06780 [Planctomicrobium sp.]|nr:hypothetical protein [Planctomicrobium sp.]